MGVMANIDLDNGLPMTAILYWVCSKELIKLGKQEGMATVNWKRGH
jgi:hypothetical protein